MNTQQTNDTQELQYLKDKVKYMGFGDKADKAIEEKVARGEKEFQIPLEITYEGQKVNYALDFKQGDKGDRYFFNSYKAELGGRGGERSQTFYVNKNESFTSKEAFNLLNGRAVNKEVGEETEQRKKVWFQLNFDEKTEKGNNKFKQFQPGYGFDLEKALDKLGIIHEKPEDKERLLKSLNKGNLEMVSIKKDGKSDQVYITANPQFKSMDLFDMSKKPIRMDQGEKKNVKVKM